MEYPRATGVNQSMFLGGGLREDWSGVGVGLGGNKKGVQL